MTTPASSFEFNVADLKPEEITQAHAQQISSLTSQLSGVVKDVSMERARRIANDNILFVARCGSKIVGMAVLVPMELPQGLRLNIESVIVDEGHRRQGIGSTLISEMIVRAARMGAPHISLTSNPTREAARGMFGSLGFAKADTSVFRRTVT